MEEVRLTVAERHKSNKVFKHYRENYNPNDALTQKVREEKVEN